MSASSEFKKYYSIYKLEEVFKLYIKHDSALGIDKMTYNNFVENQKQIFEIINRKVTLGTYRFTAYKEKLILKSRNSYPRLISIPTLRDKLVLKSLHLVLSNTFSEIKQPLPQECIQDIKNCKDKFNKFIKLDISDFYGNIRHGILIDKLKKKIKKEEILSLIKEAITTPTYLGDGGKTQEIITQGVPQGLSISNILANIYLHNLDLDFQEREDLKYIRYVDDIIIMCTEENFKKVYKEIKYELEGIYNLQLNIDKEEKGDIKENGFNFLGYALKNSSNGTPKLTVKESNSKRFENSIVKIFAKYKHSKRMSPEQFIFTINNKITGSISSKVNGDKTKEFRYGWLFYFSQMEDTEFLYHLDWFVRNLLDKFQLDHIDKKKIKKFSKAFNEIKYNFKESTYIHRPDDLNVQEKKALLESIFKIPNKDLNSERNIEKIYSKLVYKPILEYEKDISSIIS
ncbi:MULTISPECIES: reverse transcriptase domain-containing protein [unclassified Bacillus (in: firmicutes)]